MSRTGVLHVVLQLDPGGTERLVVELVRRMPPDLSAAVCCLDAGGAWASRITDTGAPLVALHRSPGFRPRLAVRLAAVARQVGARVLHCHHYSPFVYGSLARLVSPRLRVVYTEHGRLSHDPPSRKRALANRALMRGVDHVVAVSRELREHMMAEGAPSNTRVIPNGVETGRPPTADERAAARSALGLGAEDCVVVSVARLDPVKDLGTLVHAVARCRDRVPRLRLVLVGAGPEGERLQQLVASLGVSEQVQFLGRRDDVTGVLAGADIYANSSRFEGTSVTILESMAARLPVVATAVGGTPDVVVDGVTGRLVPAADPAAFADALVACATDRATAASWGEAGRARVTAHYSIATMVETYSEMYRALAAQ